MANPMLEISQDGYIEYDTHTTQTPLHLFQGKKKEKDHKLEREGGE